MTKQDAAVKALEAADRASTELHQSLQRFVAVFDSLSGKAKAFGAAADAAVLSLGEFAAEIARKHPDA